MATQQDAAHEEATQQIRVKNAKKRFEAADNQIDPAKVQEWTQLVIAEQLIHIKYELQGLRKTIEAAAISANIAAHTRGSK